MPSNYFSTRHEGIGVIMTKDTYTSFPVVPFAGTAIPSCSSATGFAFTVASRSLQTIDVLLHLP